MSTTISSMPKDARRIEHIAGTINAPDEPNHGAPASVVVSHRTASRPGSGGRSAPTGASGPLAATWWLSHER